MKEGLTEIDGIFYTSKGDAVFTEEMKKDYTILAPNYCEIHLRLLKGVLKEYGYHMEILEDSDTKEVAEVGLKYVHNDTCYPAILVIGLFMRAIMTGRYDPHKVALILTQTGGGCRASSYQYLLRKALKRAGYGFVPVLTIGVAGPNIHPGFVFKWGQISEMLRMLFYGDFLTMLKQQCEPYEVNEGETKELTDRWERIILSELPDKKKRKYSWMRKNYLRIVSDYENIRLKDEKRPKVGIVGEIYVKCAPLGNNNLERYLVESGAEPVVPGFTNFAIYCINGTVADREFYGMNRRIGLVTKLFVRSIVKHQKDMNDALRPSKFMDFVTFYEARKLGTEIIGRQVEMGEGWFLVSEIVELHEHGVNNVVIVQPFGCLPNHIVGRGTMKRMKEVYPDLNMMSIDYDASSSKVNQENRIRLLLSNAK